MDNCQQNINRDISNNQNPFNNDDKSLKPIKDSNGVSETVASTSSNTVKTKTNPSEINPFIAVRPSRGRFFRKGVLKICSKFTGEHPCPSAISIKLLSNFIEITLWHGCSPVNLLHIFRTPFPVKTSGWLLLMMVC